MGIIDFGCFYVYFTMVIILCLYVYIVIGNYLCVYIVMGWLFMLIFNKMCKIVCVYFNCMLLVRKKTNNLRYIAQLYALLYILIIRLRLKNVCLFAWYFFRVKK